MSADVTPLTDVQWREFQSIPDQGYSHRAWINARLAEAEARGEQRVRDAVEAVLASSETHDALAGAYDLTSALELLRPLVREAIGNGTKSERVRELHYGDCDRANDRGPCNCSHLAADGDS